MVSPAIFCVVVSKRPVLNSSHTHRDQHRSVTVHRDNISGPDKSYLQQKATFKSFPVFTVLFYSFISVWSGSGWLQNWDWLSSPQLFRLVYVACYSRALGPWVYVRAAHSTTGGWVGVCLLEDKERIQLSCRFVILSLGWIVIPLLPALIE